VSKFFSQKKLFFQTFSASKRLYNVRANYFGFLNLMPLEEDFCCNTSLLTEDTMKDKDKTKEQLINELAFLRRRIARSEAEGRIGSSELEALETERKRVTKQQDATTEGLRAVVTAADELITCPDVDTLFRRAVELAGDKLQATQQQIIQQERLCALGQMASGIVHDFNNALAPILGYTELLFTVPETLDDKEKTMRYLKLMNTIAKDALNIVNRLRSFYRQRDENEIFSPVNLNQLVEQASKLTEPKWKGQAQSNGRTISIRTDLRQVPLILGNPSELRNVLTNLFFNAVDAIHREGTITICTHHDDEHVVLEISDTGCGMTDEVLQRCLVPFFTTKEESGTGLGLSIVHGIIGRHEGTIEIESEPDKGTTVIIRLPIFKAQAGERQEYF